MYDLNASAFICFTAFIDIELPCLDSDLAWFDCLLEFCFEGTGGAVTGSPLYFFIMPGLIFKFILCWTV